jgi:hypothetical protein
MAWAAKGRRTAEVVKADKAVAIITGQAACACHPEQTVVVLLDVADGIAG